MRARSSEASPAKTAPIARAAAPIASRCPGVMPSKNVERRRMLSQSDPAFKKRANSIGAPCRVTCTKRRTTTPTSRKAAAFRYLKAMMAMKNPVRPFAGRLPPASSCVESILEKNGSIHGEARVKIAAAFALGLAAAAAAAAADRPVLRYIPKQGDLKYTFGGVPPAAHIAPGTRIVSWTEDCYDGAVTKPGELPSKVQLPGHDNPQTGPFYVEGAEPGDTLAIHIEKLEPARAYGISSLFPGFGALNGSDRTAVLQPDLPERVWFYSVDRARGVARTRSSDGKHSWEVPLAPFLGCLGVAPAKGEVRSTIVPDDFGGNMDCPEVRAGNTVYLGVRVP